MKFLLMTLLVPVLASTVFAVEIVGHRGVAYDAPENTLASERLAWAQGADAVELDIHLSKDGQLPVMHDFNAKRTTGHDGAVRDMTLAELKALDAGRFKGPQFAGEKVPTLEEMIALIPPGKRLFVEIKPGPEIVPALVRCLQQTGASAKNITIISFNYASLQEVRRRLPDLPTLYLVSYAKTRRPDAPPQPTFAEVMAQAKAAGLAGLDLQSTWPLTPEDVRQVRAAGLQLHVWTVDDPAVAKHWIELGADGITTNRAGWLRQQLAR